MRAEDRRPPAAPLRAAPSPATGPVIDSFGAGEPVVVLQTALGADELLPLTLALGALDGLRAVHWHRRGYAGTGEAPVGASMGDLADQAAAVIARAGIAPVHLVGVSFSAALALTLAMASPRNVHTLTLVEPPPFAGRAQREFRAANAGLVGTYEEHGAPAALERFMTMLVGEHWRTTLEAEQPGAVAAMDRDAEAFFRSDLPALWSWGLERAAVGRLECPVLAVGGEDSDPWFAQARLQLRRWLPSLDEATIPGAGHLVGSMHPGRVAELIEPFLRRHPRGAAHR